jgi:hypothetical protein
MVAPRELADRHGLDMRTPLLTCALMHALRGAEKGKPGLSPRLRDAALDRMATQGLARGSKGFCERDAADATFLCTEIRVPFRHA